MRFLCVKTPAKAHIYGHEYSLRPLDTRIENIQDILVTDTTSANELLERHADFLLEVSIDTKQCSRFPRLANRVSDLKPGSRIIIIRNGGIGDHILLLPALRILKEVFPLGTQIWLAAQKDKHPLYLHSTSIDRLLPLPLTLNRVMEAGSLIDFSSRQDWYDLKSINFTDGYLNFLGIDYREFSDKRPQLLWHQEDSPRIYSLFQNIRRPNPEKPLVLLNWKASNRLRDMPPEKLLFLARDYHDFVFIVAQSKGFSAEAASILKDFGRNVFDISAHMDTLSDYIGALANCNAVVTTDTGTVHLAEALGRPCIALYGPTIDDIWIRYYKWVFPIRSEYSGKTCTSPCGLTKNTDKGCPESLLLKNQYSPCLLSIQEGRIKSAFEQLMDQIQNAGSKIHDA